MKERTYFMITDEDGWMVFKNLFIFYETAEKEAKWLRELAEGNGDHRTYVIHKITLTDATIESVHNTIT